MELTIQSILLFVLISLTTQLTLTSKGREEFKAQFAKSIINGRTEKGIQENKAPQKYYKELLRNLKTRKSNSHARIENLSVEEASVVNKYISKFLESQIQEENELHLDPNSIPIVLNLLSAHQQHLTNANSNKILIPSTPALTAPDPNEYAQIAYIPAIHGMQSSSRPGHQDNLLSHLGESHESTKHELTSNATVVTDTRLTVSSGTTAATSIAASLTSCRSSMLCSIALAAGITAATVGAVAFPVLVAGPLLNNRKKRSAEDFDLHQDIINNYNAKHNPLVTGRPISKLPAFYYKQSDSDAPVFTLNNTQNSPTERGKNVGLSKHLLPLHELNVKSENEMSKNIANDSEIEINNYASTDTIINEGGTHINDDEIHNSNNTSYNSTSAASQLDDESENAKRGFQITTNFTLEHRIPNAMKNNTTKEELTNRLRSNLYEFFSQFDHLSEKLNISTHYEKKSNNSDIKNEQLSILGILEYYLKNNSTRLTTSNTNNSNLELSSPDPIDSFKGTEALKKIPEEPFKTISSTHLFQNLILDNHRQEYKGITTTTTTQASTTLPPIIPIGIEDLQKDLLKLLSDYIAIKQSHSSQDSGNSFSNNQLNQLVQKVQITEKPTLVNSVLPSFSTFQTIQSVAAQPNTPTQNIIPINTISSILQNPQTNPQNLNLILTKLPELINEPNKQQFQRHPIISNQKQYTQFSPTVFQNTQPSSGPYQGTPSVVQLRPPTVSSGNTSYQPSIAKPQGLSPEIKKFYGLLCKAILEPDVPLNKVTAYIAEKCLVMRFTGILRT